MNYFPTPGRDRRPATFSSGSTSQPHAPSRQSAVPSPSGKSVLAPLGQDDLQLTTLSTSKAASKSASSVQFGSNFEDAGSIEFGIQKLMEQFRNFSRVENSGMLRRMFGRHTKDIAEKVEAINHQFKGLGCHYQITKDTVFSFSTLDALLSMPSEDDYDPKGVLEALEMVTKRLKTDESNRIRRLYIEKGITHRSPAIRQHFIETLSNEKLNRELYQPFLHQLDKEDKPNIATILQEKLLTLAKPEDAMQFKVAMHLPSDQVRRLGIKVLNQEKFFDKSILELYFHCLEREQTPDILQSLKDSIIEKADPNFEHLYVQKTDHAASHIRETALRGLFKTEKPSRDLTEVYYQALEKEDNPQLLRDIQNNLESKIDANYEPLYIQKAAHEIPRIRETALKTLAKLNKSSLFPTLFEALLGNITADLATSLKGLLVNSVDATHLPIIVKGLNTNDEAIQEFSLKLLGRDQEGPTVTPLGTVPSNKSKFDNPKTMSALFDYMDNETCYHPWDASKMIINFMLAAPKSVEIRKILQDKLNSGNEKVRLTAAKSFASHYKIEEDLPKILSLLEKEESPHIKQALSDMLLKPSDSREYLEPLTQCLSDENAPMHLRELAVKATKNLKLEGLDILLNTFTSSTEKTPKAFLIYLEGTILEILTNNVGALKEKLGPDLGTDYRKMTTLMNLLQSLECPSNQVKKSTLNILDNLKSPYAIDSLFAYLEKTDNPYRDVATSAILNSVHLTSRPILLEKLSSENKEVRLTATRALKEKTHFNDMPLLLKRLQEENDTDVRQALSGRISDCGQLPEAFTILGDSLLNNPNPAVKEAALQALGHPGMKSLPTLVKAYEENLVAKNPEFATQVELKILQILSSHFGKKAQKTDMNIPGAEWTSAAMALDAAALPNLYTALGSSSKALQEAVIPIIDKITGSLTISSENLEPLFNYLENPKAQCKETISKLILSKIGSSNRPLIEAKLTSANRDVRRVATEALTKKPTESDVDITVSRLAQEKDPDLRNISLKTLMELGKQPKAFEPLAKALLSHPNPAVRVNLAQAIQQQGLMALPKLLKSMEPTTPGQVVDPGFIQEVEKSIQTLVEERSKRKNLITQNEFPGLAQTLLCKDPQLQELVLNMLGSWLNSATVEPLFTYLEHPNVQHPELATSIIEKSVKRAQSELLQEKIRSPKESVRLAAATGFCKIANASDIPVLLDALSTEKLPKIQEIYKAEIAKQGKRTDAFEGLSLVLQNHSASIVKMAAAQALKTHGSKALKPLLTALLNKQDSLSQEAVKEIEGSLAHIIHFIATRPWKVKLDAEESGAMISAITYPEGDIQLEAIEAIKYLELPISAQNIFQYLESSQSKHPDKIMLLLNKNLNVDDRRLLVNKLSSSTPTIRQAAIQGIKTLLLKESVANPTTATKPAATATANNSSGNVTYKFPLGSATTDNGNGTVRLNTEFNDQLIKEDLPALIRSLEKEDQPHLKKELAEVLRILSKDSEAFKPITQALITSGDKLVKETALDSLSKDHYLKAFPSLMDAYAMSFKAIPLGDPQATPKTEDFIQNLEEKLLDLLEQRRTELTETHLPQLAQGLQSPSEKMQKAVLKVYKQWPKDTWKLTDTLFNYLDSPHCKFASEAMGILMGTLSTASPSWLVSSKLTSQNPLARLTAARKLKESSQDDILPNLVTALEQETDSEVAEALGEAIKSIGSKGYGALYYLGTILCESSHPKVRLATVQALENHGAAALPLLFPLLESTPPATEPVLYKELERILTKLAREDDAIPSLLEQLNSPHVPTQKLSVLALFAQIEKWVAQNTNKQKDDYIGALTAMSEHKSALISAPAKKMIKSMKEKNHPAYQTQEQLTVKTPLEPEPKQTKEEEATPPAETPPLDPQALANKLARQAPADDGEWKHTAVS